jgi:sugar/nucleoside kinase (ribokinase family)
MHEGGCTRNVTECLGRLGVGKKVTFVSGIGDDDKNIFIKNSLERVGVSTDGLCTKAGQRTAVFTGVLDKNGDFFCGVADMAVLEHIPPYHLDKFKFERSKILVIDSNIGETTLDYVLSKTLSCKHIIYEPISQEKSERILAKDNLSKITIFKPNLMQL